MTTIAVSQLLYLLDAAFDGFTHGFRTLFVAFDAREPAVLRPASVAIHDDGDVTRHR